MKKFKRIAGAVLVISGSIVSGAFAAATGIVVPVVVITAAKWVGAAATAYVLVQRELEKQEREERE